MDADIHEAGAHRAGVHGADGHHDHAVPAVRQVAAVEVEDMGQVLRVLMCLAPGLTAQRIPEVATAAPQPPDLLPTLQGQMSDQHGHGL